jgi:integrase
MRKDILKRFETELSESSEHTRKARVAYARMFLEYAENRPFSQWNKDLVTGFLNKLKRERNEDGSPRYSSGSQRMIYGIVKRVFDCAKAVHEEKRESIIEEVDDNDPNSMAKLVKALSSRAPKWNVGKRSAPRVQKMRKATLSLDDVAAMVRVVREKGTPDMRAFLALASVYGLRREELVRIRPEHFKNGTLWVDTLKGGEKRDQVLAPELLPYLEKHDFSRGYSLTSMTALYVKIEYLAGLPHSLGVGWHQIRHVVDTMLVDYHDKLRVYIFLRWKLSASSDMVERYFNEAPLDVDRKVLAKHPILEMWKE